MTGRDEAAQRSGAGITRRDLLAAGVVGTGLLVLGNGAAFAGEPESEIRVGFISPRSGPLAEFGEADPFVLGLARRALRDGIQVGTKRYGVKIIDLDSQSNPARASQLAMDLITKEQVHLMLAASTPEVTNPVADACEASGVPCLATMVPWESFYFGRGGKPGTPSPFKWTFVFSFGVAQFADSFVSSWKMLKTNRKVGVLYPNDADGMAVREHLAPMLSKHGYKIVDPGPYQDGTTDFASQISLFKREECQIFNTFPIPSDFYTFWRQAAQFRYADRALVVQIQKMGTTSADMAPLGRLAVGLCAASPWLPKFPYKSPVTGLDSEALTAEYEQVSGRQWTAPLGTSMSLLDVGMAALRGAHDPLDRTSVRDAIVGLDTISTVGRVRFGAGSLSTVAITPVIGGQMVRNPAGSKFPLDLVSIENACDPRVPVQRHLTAYRAPGA